MIAGGYLRKRPGLGRIGFMATDTKRGRVEFGGNQGSWVICVTGQRTVASLAIHMRVLAGLFLFEDIRMAAFASLVPGKLNRPGGNIRDSIAAIMPILSKTPGDQIPAHGEEEQEANQKDSRESQKMAGILV